jgi:amidase
VLTISAGIVSNTAASNLTGHPTMTIPVGFTPPMPADVHSPEDEAIKLPAGLMIMGKLFDETTVFKVGDAWEQAFNWKEQV